MKDFPVFTTEYGVASLILKEVPYRREAYIIIQATEDPEALIAECVSFCRVVGAEKIYAKGHEFLEKYPLHTIIYRMQGEAQVDADNLDHLFPVTEQTVEKWRQICNDAMRNIDCAATQTKVDEKFLLESCNPYFIHNNGELLGIGLMQDTELMQISAVKPGMGQRVLNALFSTVEGASVTLEVASTNTRAIRFYEKNGFLKNGEKSRWYRVFP